MNMKKGETFKRAVDNSLLTYESTDGYTYLSHVPESEKVY